MDYIKKAHFIYDENSKELLEVVISNEFGTEIVPIYIDDFIDNIVKIGDTISHAIVSINEDKISEFLAIAYRCDFSIGILPLVSQKDQIKNLYLSSNLKENLDIALRDDYKRIDLVAVDNKLLYEQGVIGIAPLMGRNLVNVRHSFFRSLVYAVKKFFSLKVQKFDITTKNGQKITTAGIALIILNHTTKGFLSKIFNFEQSMRDGKITILIISPSSLLDYIQFLVSVTFRTNNKKTLPPSIGYIQSESFIIEASDSKRVKFDTSESIALPAEFNIIKDAIKLSASDKFWEQNKKIISQKETIKVANLPDKNEALKYMSKRIPFFKFASEDRFKELFQMLRNDAQINKTYLILMILSTLLASFGLFANSTAVIIGAMLVAPLMTPIVSLSMGLLRAETKMIRDSFIKITVGVILALIASSLLSYLLPYSEITPEMRTRINPTLLDLAIAIFSGIAAAYSKSFKEITQNLAGVAIAVALVPPLAVAGVGLGYGEIYMFLGAFLLFFTNLVGIIVAAILTFQILGFSNVVKSKKSVIFIFILLIGISYPLYISYDNMIQKYKISKMLKQHRFIVNNKYIIINKATVIFGGNVKVLNLDLLVRESLDRDDFQELKEDIQRLFNTKLFIEARVEYIL